MNSFAKGILIAGGVVCTGALCFATGGLAAPAIGGLIGSSMGLSGAAATSAGLAALGGGSLAAGGAGMVGGTALVSSVAAGVGATGAAAGSKIVGKKVEKIHNKWREEGKKEGYDEASAAYEQKLLDQADKFIKQTKIVEEERKQYEELLDEYEAEIKKLTEKVDRTEAENKYLQQLLLKEQRLKRMG